VGVVNVYTVKESQRQEWLSKASRLDVNGWIWVKIRGAPFERGFQYGSLTAKEYAEAVRVYKWMTLQTTGKEMSFFYDNAVKLQKDKIYPELLEEMEGVAAGYSGQGIPTTLDDIVGWNAWMEMTGYWWPWAQKNGQQGPQMNTGGRSAKSHCSAFIATGSATTDGKIVIGHQSFTEFWNGQFFNLVLDITPAEGYRMVMQTSPGWSASMTDFWVNSSGIVAAETTIVGFQDFDPTKIPEYVRARKASQYGGNIEEWVKLINAGNNGGYANMWLVGDINTNEIANYEQGLLFQNFQKKTDGWYFGDNAPNDPRIRNLECSDVGYDDIRQQTGARRMRWPQLLRQYEGRIDAETGKKILADVYDVYLGRLCPSSRTICSHYDEDPQPFVSDPNAVWNIPFFPGGSVDGKITTSDLARDMSMLGIFGRADGAPFDADEFLRIHSQFDYQRGYLISRPSQKWTSFDGR
jgi:hypothetical protein